MYKKILLSSAVAVAMGTAGVAQAAVDLDKPNGENPIVFAQEIAIGTGVDLDVTTAGTPAGTPLTQAGDAAESAAVAVDFGFTIGQGTSKYVRLSFDEPLAAALTTGATGDFADTSSAAATYSISQGGQAGDTFVIVEVAAPTGGDDVLQDDRFLFAPQTGDEISATNQNTRSISYELYETAVDAVNQTNGLVSKSGQWISWAPGYEVACTSANPDQIDVVDPTQFVNQGQSTTVATAAFNAKNVYTENGAAVTIAANYFGAGSTVTIEGSTDAFAQLANGFTLGSPAVSPDANPANGSATWTVSADPVSELAGAFTVNLPSSNTVEMTPSNYTLSIVDDGTQGTQYDVGTISTACGSLQFSGSTDRLDFALTPNGAFQQFARITNPSSTPGDVTVTVINDDGEQVSFDLGDVAGVDSSNLAARASTKLININDIYAAAQAADPAFALAATGPDSKNKLRIVVRGEFGGDAVEGYSATATGTTAGAVDQSSSFTGERLVERREDGIYIQGLTVARDNNAFFQTK